MSRSHSADGTVGKALRVLDLVAENGGPARLSELLERSEFPKATTYRLIQTLKNQGMLCFNADRQAYALGTRLVRLARSAWVQSSLAPIALPHIDALSAEVSATVHLAQLDNGHVLYVDKRNAADPIEMFSEAGRIGPAYCTGVGKAMLAFLRNEELSRSLKLQAYHRFTPKTLCSDSELRADLKKIRERGYALDEEEHERGIICVAVPVLATSGRVLGALSVTTSTMLKSPGDLSALAPKLTSTARSIAEEAANWRFPDRELPAGNGSDIG